MAEAINPEFIETSVHVRRAMDSGVDVLRQFSAEVNYYVSDTGDDISLGTVRGWIGWRIADEDIHDAADAISSDAEALGGIAAAIMRERPDLWIDSVLMVDRIYLEPAYRGNRLTGAIMTDLLDLLRLDVESTLVLLYPEPQRPEGGPMENGPDRDRALARMQTAYRASGFEPWGDSRVWWLPMS